LGVLKDPDAPKYELDSFNGRSTYIWMCFMLGVVGSEFELYMICYTLVPQHNLGCAKMAT